MFSRIGLGLREGGGVQEACTLLALALYLPYSMEYRKSDDLKIDYF